MSRKIKRYGYIPDLPDHRDFSYQLVFDRRKIPAKIDLRSQCPAVYDQGQLGSCTGNAIAAALEFELLKQKEADFIPSRLFIYYNERVIEGTVNEDSGAMLRDGIKSVANQGVCPEREWIYDISKFADKPTDGCYTDAVKFKALSYKRLDSTKITVLKGCLAAGTPFVFGFSVYESFESQEVAQTGVVNMPTPNENLIGGHAVLAVGYDDAQQRFIVRNSWGVEWGQQGYFTIPYNYLTNLNLADDFWNISLVS